MHIVVGGFAFVVYRGYHPHSAVGHHVGGGISGIEVLDDGIAVRIGLVVYVLLLCDGR